jgi:hypothetical protein
VTTGSSAPCWQSPCLVLLGLRLCHWLPLYHLWQPWVAMGIIEPVGTACRDTGHATEMPTQLMCMLPNRSPGLAPDERRPAPGAAQRLRLAALRSIVATASAAVAADVLQIVAGDVAEHAAACLGDSFPPAIHGAASEVRGLPARTDTWAADFVCGCRRQKACQGTLLPSSSRLMLAPPSAGDVHLELTQKELCTGRHCWRWQQWTLMRCGLRWSPWLQLQLMRRPRPSRRALPSQASCRSACLHCWYGLVQSMPDRRSIRWQHNLSLLDGVVALQPFHNIALNVASSKTHHDRETANCPCGVMSDGCSAACISC